MKISKQLQREARELFRSCLLDGLLDEARVRQVVALLVGKKPRGYIEILARLLRLVKLNLEQRAAIVESASPLSAEWQDEISRQIRGKYGQSVTVAFNENPALIGGVRIQVGSDLFDGSVQTRLKKLEESF